LVSLEALSSWKSLPLPAYAAYANEYITALVVSTVKVKLLFCKYLNKGGYKG